MDHGDPVRYEKTDASAASVVRVAVALAVVAVATALILVPGFDWLERWTARDDATQRPAALFSTNQRPPRPWLQEEPFGDLKQLRAHEAEQLGSFGWADREQGTIRMPIEDAMTIVLDRGLPVRPSPAPSPSPAGTR